MNKEESSDGRTVFNMAARAADYVGAMEMVLMEEEGVLDCQGDLIAGNKLRRDEYSPIFAVMSGADRQTYNALRAEMEAAGHIELIGGNKAELSDTFMDSVLSAGIRMQEFLVSVIVREGLLTEEEMVDLWSRSPGDEFLVPALHEYQAPLLAHLVGEASLKPC